MGVFWEGMVLGMDLEDWDDASALCYVLEFVDDWNEQVLHVKGGMDVEGMEDVNKHRAEDGRRRVEEWCEDWSDWVNGEKKEG